MSFEDLLREAAPGANALFLSALPDPKDCPADFSKGFERKMKKLLQRHKAPVLYWAKRAVACLLLAACLSGFSVLALVPEVRAAFFGWVQEVFEDVFAYRSAGEVGDSIQTAVYRPTWLPAGYREVQVLDLPGQVSVLYENEIGQELVFRYHTNFSAGALYTEKENTEKFSVQVKEMQAELYLDTDGVAVLVWTDVQSDILFLVRGHLEQEELIHIAESIYTQD